MNPEQSQFVAENEWITIKPNFTRDELHLICGDIGPFEASVPVSVPIWIAVHFKKRRKCQIVAPDWLSVDKLKEMIKNENDSLRLTPIPNCFMEIAHILIDNAKDDLDDVDQLKTYVQDLWDKRMAKMNGSVLKFLAESSPSIARLDNITQMESCYYKPAMLSATKTIASLENTFYRLNLDLDQTLSSR